jgi:hypothetical protein
VETGSTTTASAASQCGLLVFQCPRKRRPSFGKCSGPGTTTPGHRQQRHGRLSRLHIWRRPTRTSASSMTLGTGPAQLREIASHSGASCSGEIRTRKRFLELVTQKKPRPCDPCSAVFLSISLPVNDSMWSGATRVQSLDRRQARRGGALHNEVPMSVEEW